MRILIVITGLGTGGAERLVSAMSDRFVRNGHEVMLVSLLDGLELVPADGRVVVKSLSMRRTLFDVWPVLRRLRRVIREFRPDVVNSHLFHANILIRLLRLGTPMPRLVTSAHNTKEGARWRMWAYRLTGGLADISTNVSEESVTAFVGHGAVRPGRMIAIPNGIDTDRFYFEGEWRRRLRRELNVDESTPMLLAVGRLSEQKDYPNLLHSFADLLKAHAEARLFVVGEGPLRGDLVALAQLLGIENKVAFLGLRQDVRELMSACDVYVMSSAWEGLPMVLLEAMACERVVTATDCGGNRSLVGESGLIVPPHDSAALTAALVRALDLPYEERQRLGATARERVQDCFSLAAMADRYLAVYRGDLQSVEGIV